MHTIMPPFPFSSLSFLLQGLPEGYGQCSGQRMDEACAPYVNATETDGSNSTSTDEDEKSE